MNEHERREQIRRGMGRDNSVWLALITIFGIAAIVEYMLGIRGLILWWTVLMALAIAVLAVLRMMMAPRWAKEWPEHLQDERVKKIDTYARSRAWFITYFIVVVILLLSEFRIVDLGTYVWMMILFLAMTYSWIFFRWYYNRKGDVE